jgi:hypothetical protein
MAADRHHVSKQYGAAGDRSSGKEPAVPRGDDGWAPLAALRLDERHLVIVSNHKTARLWSVHFDRSNSEIMPLLLHGPLSTLLAHFRAPWRRSPDYRTTVTEHLTQEPFAHGVRGPPAGAVPWRICRGAR